MEYDGAAFFGWQRQAHQISVQEKLEVALQVLYKRPIEVVGSGRTDTGVHARGQVAHFDAPEWPVSQLRRSLNGLLQPHIAIRSCEVAAPDFHARFDATRRRYHYYIATEPFALDRGTRWLVRPTPDIEAMNAAAAYLLGEHHFGAFCRTQSETQNRVCTLFRAHWAPESRPNFWRFEIEGNRFLHGMVRAIVGTLVQVGQGKRQPEDLLMILETQDRRAAGYAAPPHGLVLEHVLYD